MTVIHHLKAQHWSIFLISLYIIANVLTLLSYYYIPLQMFRLYQRRKDDMPNPGVIKLFIWFPIFCGLSRVGHVLVFWYDWYFFYFFLDWVSAIVFTVVALRLTNVVNYLIQTQTNEQEHQINALLKKEIEARIKATELLECRNAGLQEIIRRFEHILHTEMWLHNKKQTLQELTEILASIKATEGEEGC